MDDRVLSRQERVYAYIRDQVLSGGLTPGAKLTGERRLAEELRVSRETVRQGLRLAEEAGIVVRRPTLGTFVAPPALDARLGEPESFRSTVGASAASALRCLSIEEEPAAETHAERLQVRLGAPLLRVRTLGMVDALPAALYDSLLPARVIEQLPEAPDWESQPSYRIAAAALGAAEVAAVQSFDSVGMPAEAAELLEVPPGSPATRSRSLFTAAEEPIEMRTALYPGGRCRFSISRRVEL